VDTPIFRAEQNDTRARGALIRQMLR
jgi:hypothetical protein